MQGLGEFDGSLSRSAWQRVSPDIRVFAMEDICRDGPRGRVRSRRQSRTCSSHPPIVGVETGKKPSHVVTWLASSSHFQALWRRSLQRLRRATSDPPAFGSSGLLWRNEKIGLNSQQLHTKQLIIECAHRVLLLTLEVLNSVVVDDVTCVTHLCGCKVVPR